MIYTERKYLAVIELQEERTAFSFEELFQKLMDCPSSIIYVELKGLLYGIITLGRIERAYHNHLNQVSINTKFTSIGPDEVARARQLLRSTDIDGIREKNIHVLPVTDANGRLLGNYTKWDELLSLEYSLSLLKRLNCAGFIKYHPRCVLVRPCKRSPTEQRLFSKLAEALEQKGILVETIDFCQIGDYLRAADYLLFFDGEMCEAAKTLCTCLPNFTEKKSSLLSYQVFINNLQDRTNQILSELQTQGVYVLAIDFKETKAGYLKNLEVEIENRRRQNGRTISINLFPEMREEFLLDLCEQFKGQEMPLPFSYHLQDGVLQPRDTNGPFLNIEHGCRRTTGQPEKYERCIYMYGPCPILGVYTDDQHTIPSLLQEKINLAGLKYKVSNYATVQAEETGWATAHLTRILSTPLKQGDVVVFDKYTVNFCLKGIHNLNLTASLEHYQAPSSWFTDSASHCNHKANQICAEAIYNALLPAFHQPVRNRHPIQIDNNPVRYLYLNRYFESFDASAYSATGSIVMNCNPFTFGHRYLIEEALKQVDFLIIFVVQEDSSLFSFQERFAMVSSGTADLSNVMVVPSGPFILSSMTFPEYFIKETDEELVENTENDITLFAEQIAPPLGITHRFVGEEPEDEVTNAYNQAMKRILPAHGIQLVEIPRKQDEQRVISASRVRKCLEENDFEQLDTLVPESTKNILFYTKQ